MDEPLLREHRERERAAHDALAGSSDPGAASISIGDDTELSALNANNRVSLDKTNSEEPPLWQEIIEEPLLLEQRARQRAAHDALAGSSDPGAASTSIGDDTELSTLDANSRISLEKTNPEQPPLWQEIIEEMDGPLEPPLDNNKSEDMLARQEVAKNSKEKEKTHEPLDAEKKLAGWWRRASSSSGPRTLKWPSLKQRLRAAISAREPMLPIHGEDEKQLVEKREVLYGLALATPVAILTAAAGLNLFRGGWASVAGASVGVWMLAASGMVLNQYAVFDLERLAARHLGRLGVLGAAMLFCFFTYRAFFPSSTWALWLLLIIAAIALGFPWILSCFRGDDVISATERVSPAIPPAQLRTSNWRSKARGAGSQ